MSDVWWYRYKDTQYAAPLDEYDNPVGTGQLKVELEKYRVVRETPMGVWLSFLGVSAPRFCRRDSRRRFACPTIEEARESFIARKRRQIAIHQKTVDRAKRAIRIIEHKDGGLNL